MIWQPIETAPRDGTSILVWVSVGARIEHVAWRWIDREKTCGWWAIQGNGHEVSLDDDGRKRDHVVDDEDAPTHWQPLPEPPEAI